MYKYCFILLGINIDCDFRWPPADQRRADHSWGPAVIFPGIVVHSDYIRICEVSLVLLYIGVQQHTQLVFPKKHLFFLFNKLDSLFPILGSTAGRRKAGRTLHVRQRSSRPSSSWISSLQWPTWSSKRRKLTGETLYTHCTWAVDFSYVFICDCVFCSLSHSLIHLLTHSFILSFIQSH